MVVAREEALAADLIYRRSTLLVSKPCKRAILPMLIYHHTESAKPIQL
jgi:hypothetical protein